MIEYTADITGIHLKTARSPAPPQDDAMTTSEYRVEHDSMGALDVPATALWGAQTQRAIRNFPASGLTMPRAFIRALGLIKHAAASANAELGDLPPQAAAAIQAASLEVAGGKYDDQFPVDVLDRKSVV